MTWFAFAGLNGGKAIDLAGVQEKAASGEGFHGYGDEKTAEANPNSVNFITKFLANVLISDYHAAVKEQAQPGGVNASNPAGQALAATGITTPFTDVAHALTAFYRVITNGKMWRSLGWVLLGIALIIAGLVLWIGPGAVRQSPYGRAFSAVRQARA